MKKYGAYLYVDEAHSIGALGATGRCVAALGAFAFALALRGVVLPWFGGSIGK